MAKNFPWSELIQDSKEATFDVRLIEKKIDEGFLTHEDEEKFLKTVAAETDYDFTSAEALDAEVAPEIPPGA